MARTRSSSINDQDTPEETIAAIASKKRTKKSKKGRPAKNAPVPQVEQDEEVEQVEPNAQANHDQVPPPPAVSAPMGISPEVGYVLNAVGSTMDMFQTFLANQNQRKEDSPELSRVDKFIKLNPPLFHGNKVDEDPMLWLEGVQKTLRVMKITGNDAVELAAFQLRDVAGSWFQMWDNERAENDSPPSWKEFEEAFIANFIPEEDKEAKATQFEQLKQGSKSVPEYHMEFITLAKYAPDMVKTDRAKIRRFVNGLGSHIKDNTAAAAAGLTAFSSVVGFAKNLERDKQQRREEKEYNKRARTTGGYSGSASGAGMRSSSKGFIAPAPPTHHSVGGSSFKKSQSYGNQSLQNQNFKANVSQSQSSVGQQFQQKDPCTLCGRAHSGPCMMSTGGCFYCHKEGHYKSECPKLQQNFGRGVARPAGSSGTTVAPPQARGPQYQAGRGAGRGSGSANQGGGRPRLYATLDRQSAEASPAVVTGTGVADTQATG